ncbi:hypothetical protein GUJ93_ZPchr0001g31072 [Zizania palustris]|uniref:Uncharacterized protein n=1 Tax=Zizania palustris TaxID=103762 RepID=A0A8J5S5P3_ZIZPA|nr:hypothetical protein GUJ93_ZPchr0001g31072 [Zizania palustris]
MLLSGVATNAIGFDLSTGINQTIPGKDFIINTWFYFYLPGSKGFDCAEPELTAIVTLASSVDCKTSNSSLKMLLSRADPAETCVPAILSCAPYILSLLCSQISSKDMMDPELLSKLILNNVFMMLAKVLLQLTIAFLDGGLYYQGGTFLLKQHMRKIKVPVLALAGDEDLIPPLEAVYALLVYAGLGYPLLQLAVVVKSIPQHLATFKLFGEPKGPHYAHYDLVGGRKSSNKPLHKCTIVIQCRN